MSGRLSKWLPGFFLVLSALSRWPGLFPPNFSAFYGLTFCAGAFFPGAMKWWMPLGTLALTDVALDIYYRSFSPEQFVNYVAYGGLILLGTRFSRRSSMARLLAGGLLGAIAFYVLTNTAAWLFNPFHNPEYTKDLTGWFIALTQGTRGYPTTLEFFRNTLLSGGLFTGLFAGALKWTAPEPEPQQTEPEPEEEPVSDEAPGDAKA